MVKHTIIIRWPRLMVLIEQLISQSLTLLSSDCLFFVDRLKFEKQFNK